MGNPFSSSTGVSLLSSGVSDIFGGIGDLQEAGAYNKAATYAAQNAVIAGETERLQTAAEQRQIEGVLGQQAAAYGGGNLKMSGTALDVRAASLRQGALQKAVIAEQGMINVQGWEEQSAQYKGMAQAATAAGAGGIGGGILSAIGSFFLSDDRLKEDVHRVGTAESGVGIYTFRFRGSTDVWRGVLAQDVLAHMPDAVRWDADGFIEVDHAMVGVMPRMVKHAEH